LLWAGILQHAENLDLEFLDRCPREYSFAYALESGADFAYWKEFTG